MVLALDLTNNSVYAMSVTAAADRAFDKAAIVTRPLGAYRLFLAFLVMMQHIGINLMPASVHQYYLPYAPGTIGVVAFLFFSSFLILEVASLGYLSRWRRFIANRAIRILPEYYIGLAIAIAVQFFLFHHGVAANRYA